MGKRLNFDWDLIRTSCCCIQQEENNGNFWFLIVWQPRGKISVVGNYSRWWEGVWKKTRFIVSVFCWLKFFFTSSSYFVLHAFSVWCRTLVFWKHLKSWLRKILRNSKRIKFFCCFFLQIYFWLVSEDYTLQSQCKRESFFNLLLRMSTKKLYEGERNELYVGEQNKALCGRATFGNTPLHYFFL